MSYRVPLDVFLSEPEELPVEADMPAAVATAVAEARPDPFICRRCNGRLLPGLGSCPTCGTYNPQSAAITPEHPLLRGQPPKEPFRARRVATAAARHGEHLGGLAARHAGRLFWKLTLAAARLAVALARNLRARVKD